jgi:hypothetical protein
LKSLNNRVADSQKSKEISDSNNTDMASALTYTSVTTPDARIAQNFRLVWLDSGIDEVHNDDSFNTITKLRQIVNTVQTFINVDQCIEFMTSIY